MPVLWFVAAALAFIAVGVRYSTDYELSVPAAAGGIFFLIMGIVGLARSRQ